ncbi:MAG: HIT domain-containing protein [Bacteroidota bacterium]|jgi:ATP adenylyltransferase|nr:HIT domain-containing protein [Bacteroidota bacterium]
MDRLWSPWRSQYIQTFGTELEGKGCVFCEALASSSDDARYLVRRHATCFTMLNLYPYNSGHLLVIPNRHVASYAELSAAEYAEMTELLRDWMRALDVAMHPQGYNIGSNVGRVGGAGIDQHVHMHVVPRWNGDANFMPVIADTKVISESMEDTLRRLREAFDGLDVRFSDPER